MYHKKINFVERAFIKQKGEALTRSQFSLLVLGLYAVRTSAKA
jgi:hypothetical protein